MLRLDEEDIMVVNVRPVVFFEWFYFTELILPATNIYLAI